MDVKEQEKDSNSQNVNISIQIKKLPKGSFFNSFIYVKKSTQERALLQEDFIKLSYYLSSYFFTGSDSTSVFEDTF